MRWAGNVACMGDMNNSYIISQKTSRKEIIW